MERDDVIEYSLHAHHSEEEGKKIRKKIWQVTVIMTLITLIEILVGVFASKDIVGGADSGTWQAIKIGYIILTVIKAGYIVLVFMHLGDERKSLKMTILIPYILFILYLLYICLTEALYVNNIWNTLP